VPVATAIRLGITAKHNLVSVGFTAAGAWGIIYRVRAPPARHGPEARRVRGGWIGQAPGSHRGASKQTLQPLTRTRRGGQADRCSHVLHNIQCPVASQPAGHAYLPSKTKRGKPTGMAICFFLGVGENSGSCTSLPQQIVRGYFFSKKK
jgi:hypothetical protein